MALLHSLARPAAPLNEVAQPRAPPPVYGAAPSTSARRSAPNRLRYWAGVRLTWRRTPLDPAFVRDFQQGTPAQPVPPHVVDIAVRESLKVPARVWRDVLAECLADDFAHELEKIVAPTVVLWGDNDAFVPRADQDTLVRAIAGSHLVVYRGAGHSPHGEYPQRFAAQLGAFVADVEERAGRHPVAAGRSTVPAHPAARQTVSSNAAPIRSAA